MRLKLPKYIKITQNSLHERYSFVPQLNLALLETERLAEADFVGCWIQIPFVVVAESVRVLQDVVAHGGDIAVVQNHGAILHSVRVI